MIDSNKNKFTKNSKNIQKPDNLLVLSIDNNGKISYVNKECEKIMGYLRREVVDKNFDVLIPDRHYDQWKKLFEAVKNNKQINDFRLPWLRRNGEEILAKWSIAPIGKEDGSISNIGLVGEILVDNNKSYTKNSLEKKEDTKENTNDKEEVVYQYGDKRIIFKSDKDKKNKKTNNKQKLNISKIKDKSNHNKKHLIKKKNMPMTKDQPKNSEIKDMDYKKIIKKYDSKKIHKKYEEFNENVRSIQKLKKENKNLIKKNKKLDKKLKKEKNKDKTKKINKKEKDNLGPQNKLKKISSNIIEIIGLDKKRKELKHMIEELEERKKSLKNLEDQLNKEKKEVNISRNEFVKWREKLETLENEVEKRRIDVVQQEEKFEQKLTESLKNNVCVKSDIDPNNMGSKKGLISDNVDQHEIINKIPQGAVIIQRGILKQINQPFSELVGFETDELIEKNLFDFIPAEGLSGFEKYYLDRLKGEESSSYETLILTNDKKLLSVEVNIKPMSYNGEKADMVVVTSMGEKTENLSLDDNLDKNNIEKSKPSNGSEDKNEEDHNSSKPSQKINQNQISAMFDQVRDGKDVSEINNDEPKIKQGGVPGVVTQDQIDEMVKKARDEPSNKKEPEENKKEEKTSSTGGKLSQDEINKMLEKNNKNDNPESKEKNKEDDKKEETSSSGGKMGQSDINELVKKMKKEKE